MLRSTMNVTRSGSVRRPRSSFAARPTATRSRDSSSVIASASVMRSPSSALSRIAVVGLVDGRHQTVAPAVTKRSSGTSSARRPRAPARGTCRGRRARAGRSGSGASRSSARGSRPGSRSARRPRTRARPGRRARRGSTRRARPRARSGPGCAGSGAAQTANTIGRPVRSSQRRPRSWCGVGSSNADLSAASPISSFASASSPSGTCSRVGQQHLRQHDRGRRLGRDRDGADAVERRRRDELDRVDRALGRDAEPRQQPQDVGVARVLDRRDRRRVELAGDAARRLSSVGTPTTSSYSASTRKKTGAMFA